MFGIGKFFQEKFGKIGEKVDKLKEEITPGFVNLTAKVNEKVTSLQSGNSKLEVQHTSFDLQIAKLLRNIAFWFLAVVQEPSLGMYYVQNHFKESLDKTLNSKKEFDEFHGKLNGLQLDVQRTRKEVEGIAQLNSVWANSMSILLDQLTQSYEKN